MQDPIDPGEEVFDTLETIYKNNINALQAIAGSRRAWQNCGGNLYQLQKFIDKLPINFNEVQNILSMGQEKQKVAL